MLKGSIVQQLHAAHEDSKRPIRFGVYYKNTLVALCHALEDWILEASSAPIMITAFQQGKWYLQEAERYADLAQKSRHVVIMAAPDTGWQEHPTSQRENVDLVSLETDDPVAQEWHLIIFSPSYTAIVLCQELSASDYGPAGIPENDRDRKFYGLWTFEPQLVRETVDLTLEHIQRYNPELATRLTAQLQAMEMADPQRDDLGEIVSRVVNYLQNSQATLDTDEIYPSSHQALDKNLVSNEIQAFLRMAQLMDMADVTNPFAAAEVAALAEMMGQLLDLPAWQMKRLRLASLLHRLDPVQNMESIVNNEPGNRYHEDGPACRLVRGAQVLRRMPQLSAVAKIINHQNEWWNGSGEPARLAGDQIPLESRILALAAYFQQQWATYRNAKRDTHIAANDATQALSDCQQQQGERWDPKLIETLTLVVMGMQQGLDLPVQLPKVTAGMWLLDFQVESDATADETSQSYSN
jgi:DICT domain-containing protein